MTATITAPIECEGAMSDAVLQASRAALSIYLAPVAGSRAYEIQWINRLPEKQRPLIPLLMALLDSAQTTAKAINDNAHDDSAPLAAELAREVAKQCEAIADVIQAATECPDASEWSLPSMTGKELV